MRSSSGCASTSSSIIIFSSINCNAAAFRTSNLLFTTLTITHTWIISWLHSLKINYRIASCLLLPDNMLCFLSLCSSTKIIMILIMMNGYSLALVPFNTLICSVSFILSHLPHLLSLFNKRKVSCFSPLLLALSALYFSSLFSLFLPNKFQF